MTAPRSPCFSPWDPDAAFSGRIDLLGDLISGWINPVFIAAVAFSLFGSHERLFAVLRAVAVLMIPFCWIVFYRQSVYPREGHFVWIIGMLLVLFSPELDNVLVTMGARGSGSGFSSSH